MRSFMWSEFLSSKGEDNEEIKDGSELNLGDAYPLWISRTIKHQSLGMPKASPLLHRLSWGCLRWTKFLALYILCDMLGASFYFQFCLFVCLLVISLLDPSFICVGERYTPLFRLLLCFAYILLSILSYCKFASKLLLLAFILFRAASSCC